MVEQLQGPCGVEKEAMACGDPVGQVIRTKACSKGREAEQVPQDRAGLGMPMIRHV